MCANVNRSQTTSSSDPARSAEAKEDVDRGLPIPYGSSEYWDWSWDELAEYDLPATVEYVYGHTGKQKLHYVGHSPGTLMALASFCHSELQEMVISAVLLSPNAYSNKIGPATATKNIIHLSQMIRRGTLAKFDYDDCDKNTKHYGQEVPPAYDISSFPHDLPLLLGYGGEDGLSDGGDGLRLMDGLRFHDQHKLTVLYRLDYGHDDFIMAVNAKQLVYDRVIGFSKLH
ncbi:triacylglycerol lipase 2-like [Musa acuminata AAA Group]|uniref:triacylglycerol lipase 2-like n=1 Tax=Musa acuminata AAA Group TaxID=214697 RepID=UPI0031DDA775